jgi:hypothetical protein
LELETNVIMRSVYQSKLFRARFTDYSSTTGYSYRADYALAIIADCARKYTTGAVTTSYGGTVYTTVELAIINELFARLSTARYSVGTGTGTALAYTAAELKVCRQLFDNVAFRGVTSFIEYSHVFRRTVTAGDPSAVRANYEGAGKIWTTAEVNTWEQIPNDGWFALPVSQWHKDKPSCTKAYGQKTQITYSYTEITTASALLYEAYASATMIDTA